MTLQQAIEHVNANIRISANANFYNAPFTSRMLLQHCKQLWPINLIDATGLIVGPFRVLGHVVNVWWRDCDIVCTGMRPTSNWRQPHPHEYRHLLLLDVTNRPCRVVVHHRASNMFVDETNVTTHYAGRSTPDAILGAAMTRYVEDGNRLPSFDLGVEYMDENEVRNALRALSPEVRRTLRRFGDDVRRELRTARERDLTHLRVHNALWAIATTIPQQFL